MRGLAVRDRSSSVLSLFASYVLRADTLSAVKVLFTDAGILGALTPCSKIWKASAFAI